MFEDLYRAAEDEYGLPTGILRSMAVQESNENPWAIRYEPGFFARYLAPSSNEQQLGGVWPHEVSNITERMARATSFGLIQVMGQVARELGFTAPFLSLLCDPATGLNYGAMHLRNKLKKYGTLALAVSAYNAGAPNPANTFTYVNPILDRMNTQPVIDGLDVHTKQT